MIYDGGQYGNFSESACNPAATQWLLELATQRQCKKNDRGGGEVREREQDQLGFGALIPNPLTGSLAEKINIH